MCQSIEVWKCDNVTKYRSVTVCWQIRCVSGEPDISRHTCGAAQLLERGEICNPRLNHGYFHQPPISLASSVNHVTMFSGDLRIA